MNKKIKFYGIFAIILVMGVCFVGCENNKNSGKAGKNNSAKEKINIADIAWSVDEGIVDGEHYILLDYTNSTPYTIVDFKITFKEKSGITEEEKSTFYSDIQKKFNASDEDMEELKERTISMYAETGRVVNPDESVSNVNCYYYGGSYYLKDISHFNLVEPDIATIKYIEEDEIFTTYYDYNSKKYSAEAETEMAY